LASALALLHHTNLDAEEIVRKSMEIAGNMCLYTNHNLIVEIISKKQEEEKSNLPK
jgi:ATP-dependent HslUV protease, peptidase subunit HslV